MIPMLRILLVQSRKLPEGLERERKNFERVLGNVAVLETISAFDERLAGQYLDTAISPFDGIIFGGSPEYDFDGGRNHDDPARLTSQTILSRAKGIISFAREHDVAVLGVCFGHHLVASMHGGQVCNDKRQHKFGTHEIHLTKEGKADKLFSNFPKRFTAQYGHKDSVAAMPVGSTLLASSEVCSFSALRYGERVYTVQFHPEIRNVDQPQSEQFVSPEASTLVSKWVERVVA